MLRRIAVWGFVGLSLAACAGPGSANRDAVTAFTASGRTIGAGPDVVEVETSFRSFVHQIEKIELVAPDGRRYAAAGVATVVEQSADGAGRYGSVGVHGGSGGVSGVGVGISLGWILSGFQSEAPPTVRARATVPVEDPAAYRRDWRRWRIAVTVSRGGTAPEQFFAAAPAPPA